MRTQIAHIQTTFAARNAVTAEAFSAKATMVTLRAAQVVGQPEEKTPAERVRRVAYTTRDVATASATTNEELRNEAPVGMRAAHPAVPLAAVCTGLAEWSAAGLSQADFESGVRVDNITFSLPPDVETRAALAVRMQQWIQLEQAGIGSVGAHGNLGSNAHLETTTVGTIASIPQVVNVNASVVDKFVAELGKVATVRAEKDYAEGRNSLRALPCPRTPAAPTSETGASGDDENGDVESAGVHVIEEREVRVSSGFIDKAVLLVVDGVQFIISAFEFGAQNKDKTLQCASYNNAIATTYVDYRAGTLCLLSATGRAPVPTKTRFKPGHFTITASPLIGLDEAAVLSCNMKHPVRVPVGTISTDNADEYIAASIRLADVSKRLAIATLCRVAAGRKGEIIKVDTKNVWLDAFAGFVYKYYAGGKDDVAALFAKWTLLSPEVRVGAAVWADNTGFVFVMDFVADVERNPDVAKGDVTMAHMYNLLAAVLGTHAHGYLGVDFRRDNFSFKVDGTVTMLDLDMVATTATATYPDNFNWAVYERCPIFGKGGPSAASDLYAVAMIFGLYAPVSDEHETAWDTVVTALDNAVEQVGNGEGGNEITLAAIFGHIGNADAAGTSAETRGGVPAGLAETLHGIKLRRRRQE